MTHPAWPEGAKPVTIPAAEPRLAKAWAKIVTGINPDAAANSKSKGAAIEGVWLERGGVYALQCGTLIAVYGLVEERDRGHNLLGATAHVALYRVTEGGEDSHTLTEVKTWTNKQGIIGAQVINGINTHIKKAKGGLPTPGPLAAITISTPARVNTRTEACYRCGQTVPAGQGILVRADGGRSRARHNGQCPPPPPMRNDYPQNCDRCGQLVPAGQGILLTRADPYEPWRVRHDGECPPKPATPTPTAAPAVRRNAKPGICTRCLQDVPAGAGELHGGPGHWTVTHVDGACPPHPLNPGGAPTWTLTTSDGLYGNGVAREYPAGTAFRVTGRYKDVPTTAPGYRMLSTPEEIEQLAAARVAYGPEVTFIAMSLASHTIRTNELDDPDDWHNEATTVFRVATPEEAAPVLAAEAKRERRAELARRVTQLLAISRMPRTTDHTQPAPGEFDPSVLDGLPTIPLPKGVGDSAPPYTPRAWLDRERGVIWTAAHNGLDGDNWSPNNWGGYIVRSHPLTPERQQLIADLVAEYDNAEALAQDARAAYDAAKLD